MLRTVLSREMQDGFSSSTFLVAIALFTVLVPLSAVTQAFYYKQVVEDYAVREKIHGWEKNSEAVVLTRRVPAMLPFCNGVYDSLPDEVTLRGDSVLQNPSAEDFGPLNWLFPDRDLSLIVGILLTLMAILLSHDSVTGDREQGTLKMILSTAVSRRTVLAAKLLGVTLLMFLTLLYCMLLYSLSFALFSGGRFHFSASTWLTLGGFALISMLTIMVFTALGLAVSTNVRSSSSSLALCMASWVLIVLIWPSLSPYIATTFWPVPPKQAAQREIFERETELVNRELEQHREAAGRLAAAKVDAETAWGHYLLLQRGLIERREQEVSRLISERQAGMDRQGDISRRLLSLSPYGAFKLSLVDLCETGVRDYENFVAAAERYYQSEFLPAIFKSKEGAKPWLGLAANQTPMVIEPFGEPSESAAEKLKVVAFPVALIALQACLLIGISFWRFERYDAR